MRLAMRSGFAAGLRAAAPVVAMGAVVFLLLRYPPQQYGFYPRCPIFQLLDVRCPGCGATRALAAMLRGQFVEAWHQNALLLLILPVCVLYCLILYARWVRGEALGWRQPSRAAVRVALVIAAVFMVVRNLAPGRF